MDADHDIPSRLEAISTRWTLLRQAHAGSTFSSAEARNMLVLRYLPAVRRYVGVMMQGDEAAADVTQDILVRLLDGDFGGADPGRGRFRDLLKVAIRNMVRNDWARQKRRRPIAMDVSELAAEASDPDDGTWLIAWRKSVLDLAWNALEQQQRQQPGSVAYTLLRLRIDHPDDTSEQLAERLSRQLGKPVRPDALRQKLRRAQARVCGPVAC